VLGAPFRIRGTDRSAVVAGEQKLVLGKRICKTGCRFKPKIRLIAPGCSTALWNVVNVNCLLTSADFFDTYHRKIKITLELRKFILIFPFIYGDCRQEGSIFLIRVFRPKISPPPKNLFLTPHTKKKGVSLLRIQAAICLHGFHDKYCNI